MRCWAETDVGCSVVGQVLKVQHLGIWARLLIAKQEFGIRVFRAVSGQRDVFQDSWAGWRGCVFVVSPHPEINLYLIKHDKIMQSMGKSYKQSQSPVLICPAVHPGHGISATAERESGQVKTEDCKDFALSFSSFFLSLEMFSHVVFSIKFTYQVSSYPQAVFSSSHRKNMQFDVFSLLIKKSNNEARITNPQSHCLIFHRLPFSTAWNRGRESVFTSFEVKLTSDFMSCLGRFQAKEKDSHRLGLFRVIYGLLKIFVDQQCLWAFWK